MSIQGGKTRRSLVYALHETWFAMVDIRWRLLGCRGGKKLTRGVWWTMSSTSLNQVVL